MSLIILANQYEEKLKNTVEKEVKDDHFLSILYKLGLIPLLGEDSLLGEGAYSSVFRVLYKGKPAVAKVSKYQKEFDMSIKLFNLKNSLGEQAKHIMDIYHLFKVDYINILVVEELYPINSHVSSMLFSNRKIYNLKEEDSGEGEKEEIENLPKTLNLKKHRFLKLLEDNDFVSKLINEKIISNTFKIFLINNNLYDRIFNLLNNKLQNKDLLNNIAKSISQIIFDINIICKNFKSRELYIKCIIDLQDRLYFILNKMTGPEKIFKAYSDVVKGHDFPEMLPEAESLMKCLHKLKDLGISWRDLHYKNIMERKDHTLVISDPGLFREI